MMAYPEQLPAAVLAHVMACDQCESKRRPRMFVCTYHEGWWDGWEAANPREGDTNGN